MNEKTFRYLKYAAFVGFEAMLWLGLYRLAMSGIEVFVIIGGFLLYFFMHAMFFDIMEIKIRYDKN